MPDELTARQAKMLRQLLRCYLNGHMPTIRALGEAMGITSPNGVMAHLRALRRKGYVHEADGSSVRLSDKALALVLG
ncbi:MAG: hypothetical protein AB7G28_26445 [Pirellulales bacterium]